MNGEMQFGNKKRNNIDEAPVSKHAARNQKKILNKTIAASKLMQEIEIKKVNEKKQIEKSSPTIKNDNRLDPKIKKKIEDIKRILPQFNEKVILATLEKHSYDQQETLEQLFTKQQDFPEPEQFEQLTSQQSTTQTKSKSKSKAELGNDLLNEIYQNNEDIDPSEFEQLFAQIAEIIKEEEKSKGMDLFEINQFIDDCYLIKNVILEDQGEIYIDENDQLCRQTQLFMEEIIKNRVALEVKRQEDFPTLGAITKSNNTKGTIQKIQQGYQKQRQQQQFFVPSKVPQLYNHNSKDQYKKNSLFSVNNNPRSYEDILQLSKQYNDMGIERLKYVYLRLQDINLCKRFLDRFYPNHKRIIKVQKIQDKDKSKDTRYTKLEKPVLKSKYKRLEDENFRNYSLREIRDELDHLFKLRNLFRVTKGKTTNIAHRKQLERLAHRDDSRITKLTEVARYKAIENMIENNIQYIDLHGYREEQIEDLFDDIADMIKTQFKKGNSKLQTSKVGSSICCMVRALTGKGLHSKYNRSVLKPCLISWCESNGIKKTETQDSITVCIEVK